MLAWYHHTPNNNLQRNAWVENNINRAYMSDIVSPLQKLERDLHFWQEFFIGQ